MGDIEKMINNNSIGISQFFTMHPFSLTDKILYEDALSSIDYFKKLYIKSFKTFERLATICSVIDNSAKNLIVVTGFRGCGKTNFLQLIKRIAEGFELTDTIGDSYHSEINNTGNSIDLKTLVDEKWVITKQRIRSSLFLSEDFDDDNEKKLGTSLNEYIINHISGPCNYINFDVGGMGREKPFSTKLFFLLRESLSLYLSTGRFFNAYSTLYSFVIRNRWLIEENLENIYSRKLKSFWVRLNKKIMQLKAGQIEDEQFYDFLFESIKRLDLEQVFFIFNIWEYTKIVYGQEWTKNQKLLYLLDNIDMISDSQTDIFNNTIMGIWRFIWDTRALFAKISERSNPADACYINVYNKAKIIVAMRETTAMHISEHLRDKMRGLMEHFDMSDDVEKSLIMQRRIDFGKELMKSGRISNMRFNRAIRSLDQLVRDRLLMKNLFLLYNNDYRTSMASLLTICIERLDLMNTAIELMKSNENYKVFGGRGIVYRLIIDAFFGWGYFDGIGISSIKRGNRTLSRQSQNDYSFTRVLLTLMCNKQSKNTERFFVNPEESVKLLDLYKMVKNFMTEDDFSGIIEGMYSLKNKKYWNHLVTFDNIWNYSPTEINEYLISEEGKLDDIHNIYIRATTAGQIFLAIICVHFEYYSSRFCTGEDYVPLFSLNNLHDSVQYNKMTRILSEVYRGVKSCCNRVERYNMEVLQILGKTKYEEIVGTPYFYERQFHEERIIHSHISYLESYREYINEITNDFSISKKANEYIISIIKNYLELLKYDKNGGIKLFRDTYYSPNSKKLYNELSVCIERIDYRKESFKRIEITRKYYKENFEGQFCNALKEEK